MTSGPGAVSFTTSSSVSGWLPPTDGVFEPRLLPTSSRVTHRAPFVPSVTLLPVTSDGHGPVTSHPSHNVTSRGCHVTSYGSSRQDESTWIGTPPEVGEPLIDGVLGSAGLLSSRVNVRSDVTSATRTYSGRYRY